MVGKQVCNDQVPQLSLHRQRLGQGAIVVRSRASETVVFVTHYLGMLRANQDPGPGPDGTQPELKIGRRPAIRAIKRPGGARGVGGVHRAPTVIRTAVVYGDLEHGNSRIVEW